MARWRGHSWPGNVRELQNAVNQAVLLSTGRLLDLSAAAVPPADSRNQSSISSNPAVAESACPCGGLDLDDFRGLKEYSASVTARCERAAIVRILEREGWNRSAAARALDITRKTLATKMVEYGIQNSRLNS
jgi:DNA-binding NtrC family response regulator